MKVIGEREVEMQGEGEDMKQYREYRPTVPAQSQLAGVGPARFKSAGLSTPLEGRASIRDLIARLEKYGEEMQIALDQLFTAISPIVVQNRPPANVPVGRGGVGADPTDSESEIATRLQNVNSVFSTILDRILSMPSTIDL